MTVLISVRYLPVDSRVVVPYLCKRAIWPKHDNSVLGVFSRHYYYLFARKKHSNTSRFSFEHLSLKSSMPQFRSQRKPNFWCHRLFFFPTRCAQFLINAVARSIIQRAKCPLLFSSHFFPFPATKLYITRRVHPNPSTPWRGKCSHAGHSRSTQTSLQVLVLCVCVCVAAGQCSGTTENLGWEVLSPQCTWDGSSSVHNDGFGTGVAVVVVGRDAGGMGV